MAVFFDCQFLEMFLHVFLQYWKLDRTDFKKILVKSFWIKVVAEYSLPFCLQIKKTEVSPAVFQIIGGRFHDILVDLRYCICICDSKKFQQSGGFVLTPAIIMDADVQKGIDAQINTAVQPSKTDIVRAIIIIQIIGSILISIRFYISCPAFDVAAGGDQIADIRRFCVSKEDSLIQMSWKSLMRQSCKKFQVTALV